MHAPYVDALARLMAAPRSRRRLLHAAAASMFGTSLATADAKNGRRRRRAHDRCGKKRRCGATLTCAGKRCCRPQRVFVHCPADRLCIDDNHCCAAKHEVEALCCPKTSVCGDFCCGPDSRCAHIEGAPRCACMNDAACPDGFACLNDECVCQLPPEQCGAGGVGFVTVRRP